MAGPTKNTGRGAAAPAAGPLTTKQQRAARRAEKVAELKRQQARTRRNRIIGIVAGATAVAVVAVTLVVFVVTNGTAKAPPSTAAIAGVQTFPGLTATHVTGAVTYKQQPPVGGDHAAVLLNCAVYSVPVPNENAVHSLEHGAVWVTYDATAVSGATLAKLRALIPSTFAILSPYAGLPGSIVASAWGVQLDVTGVDDPRLSEFIAKYSQAKSAPEPGAPCSGGVDGQGRVS